MGFIVMVLYGDICLLLFKEFLVVILFEYKN